MAISGIGSSNTYIYHVQTGKLSTKDGSADDFVDYFNGDIRGELPNTLNGFDQKRKGEMQTMLGLIQSGHLKVKGTLQEHNAGEYEITSEIADATTTHFSVNGEKIFTAYGMGAFTYIDDIMSGDLLYKSVEAKGYDPSDNSVNIAVGDVFDLGNGYRLTVKEGSIQVEGPDDADEEKDKKAKQLAYGLNALIRFADQQWIADMIDKESTPMLLNLLRELGVDTSREFQINGTKCEIRYGKIKEVGNRFGIPSSVFNEAVEKYEKFLYTPISERVSEKA